MSSEKVSEDPMSGEGQTSQKERDEKSGEQKKLDEKHQKPSANVSKKDEEKGDPPGGFDATPIPHAPPGYTVKITLHRATNLPMADLTTMSSDPYCLAQINTGLRTRHKEDPVLSFRTHTIWKSTEPEWNEEWILAHIPASGFKLKVRIYDEDATDRDDRLGNVHVHVDRISENWEGIKNQPYKIKKRAGSKRAYMLRAVAVCMDRAHEMSGDLYVSVEVLGKSDGDEGGRAYTAGLNYWCQHRSPLLGRIANRKDDNDDEPDRLEPDHVAQSRTNTGMPSKGNSQKSSKDGKGKKTSHYDFQANQFQLTGPVPPELYHRFVEFKPWIAYLFNSKGLSGHIMHAALHKQHVHVYNYNRLTSYGVFDGPSTEMTQKFLDLVHYDEGGRIFTYVLTLDALFRFTETGKEFGIDMLSKHTMHSDASIYIAFSGEFFIRRLKNPDHGAPAPKRMGGNGKDAVENDNTHPPKHISGGPPDSAPPKDPRYYELVIDNDSGTYRPNKKLLPLLREFLHKSFPGLKIITLDSQDDAEVMKKMKDQQREFKKKEGSNMVYKQHSRGSSVSSSDEEALDRLGNQDAEADEASQGGKRQTLMQAVGPLANAVPHPKDWFAEREVEGHEGERDGAGVDPMKQSGKARA